MSFSAFVIFHALLYNLYKSMEGRVILKSDKPKKDPKYYIVVTICLFLILGPFLVHGWSLLPVLNLDIVKKMNPNIKEADMLSYWGTAFSCIGTLLLAYVTIKQSDRANEINDRLLKMQEREDKEAYVNLSQDDIKLKEEKDYRFVELKFNNITDIPINNIDIEGCDKRIIKFNDRNWNINSNGYSVFISEYEGICDDMNYDSVSNGYRLYLKDYGESFRILSFKVIVTSLYGVSTEQYFNVLMMKSRAEKCRCTL